VGAGAGVAAGAVLTGATGTSGESGSSKRSPKDGAPGPWSLLTMANRT
jgi:hypothetical protein